MTGSISTNRPKDTTPRFVGIIAGAPLGSRPFDPASWSGCSQSFFMAAKRAQVLHRAFGVELSRLRFGLLAVSKFSTEREVWRRRIFMSSRYRLALEREVEKHILPDDYSYPILQIGAYINAKRVYGSTAITGTYQDGNNIEYQLSSHVPPSLLEHKDLLRDCFLYERDVAQSADYVFTTSNYIRRSFVEHYGIDAKKVVCVGMGLNFPAPANLDLSKKDYERRDIVFIGREFQRKGGRTAVEGFRSLRSRFPDATLHIIGPIKAPSEINGERGVVFHGYLNRQNPRELERFTQVLLRAVVLVAPSQYEPFGLAPLEAMAYGLPAIVTNKWALAENIIPGVSGEHVDPGDSAGLADILAELLLNPQRLQAMGRTAREIVLREYDWRRVAESISMLLNSRTGPSKSS